MNDINNGYDRHLDPPDMDEASYCETCGHEFREVGEELVCMNRWCPDEFISTSMYRGSRLIEMANHLVEVEQELADAKNDLQYAQARITNLKTRLERAEQYTKSGE